MCDRLQLQMLKMSCFASIRVLYFAKDLARVARELHWERPLLFYQARNNNDDTNHRAYFSAPKTLALALYLVPSAITSFSLKFRSLNANKGERKLTAISIHEQSQF